MPGMFLYLDEIENKIVNKLSEEWSKSKPETIKKIVRDYVEDD